MNSDEDVMLLPVKFCALITHINFFQSHVPNTSRCIDCVPRTVRYLVILLPLLPLFFQQAAWLMFNVHTSWYCYRLLFITNWNRLSGKQWVYVSDADSSVTVVILCVTYCMLFITCSEFIQLCTPIAARVTPEHLGNSLRTSLRRLRVAASCASIAAITFFRESGSMRFKQ